MKFTAKEQRLIDYLISDKSRNCGDMCKALHTTPKTLLGKTFPGLERKGIIRGDNMIKLQCKKCKKIWYTSNTEKNQKCDECKEELEEVND